MGEQEWWDWYGMTTYDIWENDLTDRRDLRWRRTEDGKIQVEAW